MAEQALLRDHPDLLCQRRAAHRPRLYHPGLRCPGPLQARRRGYEVFFLTGTDEHGQKVEKAATSRGRNAAGAGRPGGQALSRRSGRSSTSPTPTSSAPPRSATRKGCSQIFRDIQAKGDIYLGEYEDWYCTPCETFWTETQLIDGNCPDCSRPTEKLKETPTSSA